MILRAKTKYLFDKFSLSEEQKRNSELNLREIENSITHLESFPRRLVFELTNACNLHCIMCGRESRKFTPTFFQLEWLETLAPALEKTEEAALFGWGEPTVHPHFSEILRTLDHYPLRKYFCTNGMRLDMLMDAIFEHHVDIIAISLDGANAETNNRIRAGGDFDRIVASLRRIVQQRNNLGIKTPYLNFVFCMMESNYHELPDMVRLAADIGLDEVKAVYFTSFAKELAHECLWDKRDKVARIFEETEKLAEDLGIIIKLPYLPGEDPAGNNFHRECFVGWRDLFLGSDGYVRPCMSTPDKFFRFTEFHNFDAIWNHLRMQEFRRVVNDKEHMPNACRHCYQSSHCNWNRKESFYQMNENFAPEWEGFPAKI